jgi:hypothetical protein
MTVAAVENKFFMVGVGGRVGAWAKLRRWLDGDR